MNKQGNYKVLRVSWDYPACRLVHSGTYEDCFKVLRAIIIGIQYSGVGHNAIYDNDTVEVTSIQGVKTKFWIEKDEK